VAKRKLRVRDPYGRFLKDNMAEDSKAHERRMCRGLMVGLCLTASVIFLGIAMVI